MKRLFQLIFLIIPFSLFGQSYNMTSEWNKEIFENLSKKEYKDSLSKYDFGKLWTKTENKYVYGIIGANYQRIKIKILTTEKHKNNPNSYEITGKSLVRNNICSFRGIITIQSIKIYNVMHWGVDDEYKDKKIKKQGVLIAKYKLEEDSLQTHSGIFEGKLFSSWYIDKNGKLEYDSIEYNSDNYRNNQFIGTWTEYKTQKKKDCNWADYRVPNSGDLDVGAGGFSPNYKYFKFGWQTYRDAYFGENMNARKEEERQWWQ